MTCACPTQPCKAWEEIQALPEDPPMDWYYDGHIHFTPVDDPEDHSSCWHS